MGGNAAYLAFSSGAVLFWAGPFTPAIELQIAFILLLKKMYDKIKFKGKSHCK